MPITATIFCNAPWVALAMLTQLMRALDIEGHEIEMVPSDEDDATHRLAVVYTPPNSDEVAEVFAELLRRPIWQALPRSAAFISSSNTQGGSSKTATFELIGRNDDKSLHPALVRLQEEVDLPLKMLRVDLLTLSADGVPVVFWELYAELQVAPEDEVWACILAERVAEWSKQDDLIFSSELVPPRWPVIVTAREESEEEA